MTDTRRNRRGAPGRFHLSDIHVYLLWRWVVRTRNGYQHMLDLIERKVIQLDFSQALTALWAALRNHWKHCEDPPTYSELVAELSRSSQLSAEEGTFLHSMMEVIYDRKLPYYDEYDAEDDSRTVEESLPPLQGRDESYLQWLVQWAEDCAARRLRDQIVEQEGVITEDMPEMLRKAALDMEAIRLCGAPLLDVPFPDDQDLEQPVVRIPTGIRTFDNYMNGGQSPGEVYGFCGPIGSCKTMVGIQLAVSAVSYYQSLADNGLAKFVYLVFWEGPIEHLRRRILSCAGRISIHSLESGLKGFSTNEKNLKPYEKQLFKNKLFDGIRKPEIERYHLAKDRLNRNLRIIDVTTDENYRGAGSRLIKGVAEIIKADQQRNGNPGVGLVVLDYAGLAVRRYMAYTGCRQEELRHLLIAWASTARSYIAIPYQCPVWCLHQLSNEAASRSPGALPKLTDAAEARNFLENMDFGFYVGVPDHRNLCVVHMVKQRRSSRKPESIWQIDGELNQVVDVSNQYKRTSANTIVNKSNVQDLAVEPNSPEFSEAHQEDYRSLDRLFGK